MPTGNFEKPLAWYKRCLIKKDCALGIGVIFIYTRSLIVGFRPRLTHVSYCNMSTERLTLAISYPPKKHVNQTEEKMAYYI